MFLKRVKEKEALNLITSSLQQKLDIEVGGKVSKVGVVFNYNEFDNVHTLLSLAKTLHLEEHNFRIVAYINKKQKNKIYDVPVFDENDLKRKGEIQHIEIANFYNTTFDVLINFYNEAPLPLKLVSARTIAYLKVGLNQNTPLNDIVFKMKDMNFSEFNIELVKYLKILKRF
ncbi:DUF6913 domain-containing protein [Zhouia sp. PK063]|uniref:DUF6913 domain-containing protein n=1 Tax=Zhouia sp. PK063 TaxID=3373602 RepID=UPI003792BAF0